MRNSNSKYLIIGLIIFAVVILVLILSGSKSNEPKKTQLVFTFKEDSTKLKIGEAKAIEYELNDNTKTIEWFSTSDVVTIDDNGVMRANKYGQAIVSGTIVDGTNSITNTCYVTTYTGDINVKVEDIQLNEGYLLMKSGSEYSNPFIIVPSNAYIDSLEYYSTDESIANIQNNQVIAGYDGSAILSCVVNKQITKDLQVEVSNNVNSNGFAKMVERVSLNENDITMDIGNTKQLSYKIEPSDGYVGSIRWASSNERVVKVLDGKIEAINSGEATIQIIVNNNIKDSIVVIVNKKEEPTPVPTATPTVATIVIDKKPKTTITVGEKTDIIAHVVPKNSGKTIKYISSNTKVATVDQNGIITGVKAGRTTITLFMGSGKAKYYTITVKNKPTSPSTSPSSPYTWGYQSSKAKTPVYAGASFYQNLASQGRGSFNGSVYSISSSYGSFSYNVNTCVLSTGGSDIKVRVFYPPETDLGSANTLVYLGGDGEANFGGYFSEITGNPSVVRSSGILILVAQGSGTIFDGNAAIYATRFVQAFTSQKAGVKNSVLGFSTGGKFVLDAANRYGYNRAIIFSSWSPDTSSPVNVKNKEVLYFVPSEDSLYRLAKETLVELRNYGYQNVTLVTNSSELLSMFNGSSFKIINPGTGMVPLHVSRNVALSGIVAYAND